MKTFTQFALLFAATVGNAFGVLYHGSILQTVTQTNNGPSYFVGQTFVGHYSYDAPSVDGVFYSNANSATVPAGANASLTGQVYLTHAVTDAPDFHMDPGYFDFFSSMHNAVLTVSGGVVIGFSWIWEAADNYALFSGLSFSTLLATAPDPETQQYLETHGNLSFSAPNAPEVPDVSPSLALLGLSVMGLVALRRTLGAR